MSKVEIKLAKTASFVVNFLIALNLLVIGFLVVSIIYFRITNNSEAQLSLAFLLVIFIGLTFILGLIVPDVKHYKNSVMYEQDLKNWSDVNELRTKIRKNMDMAKLGAAITDSWITMENMINQLMDASEYLKSEFTLTEQEKNQLKTINSFAIQLKEKYY